MVWEIIVTIVIGFVVGAVAKILMPGKDPGGFIITILLGIAGSFIAKYVSLWTGLNLGQMMTFVASVVGAIILLIIYRLIKK